MVLYSKAHYEQLCQEIQRLWQCKVCFLSQGKEPVEKMISEERDDVTTPNTAPTTFDLADNSCQTHPLRDYSIDAVLHRATKCRNTQSKTVSSSPLSKDDNFRILQPDYAAYSEQKFSTPIETLKKPSRKSEFLRHLKYPKINAVYRTFSGLKIALEKKCKESDIIEKCSCEHCGAYNVINESLKRPATFDFPEEDREVAPNHFLKKNKKKHQSMKNLVDEPAFISLVIKVKVMEERIAELEQIIAKKNSSKANPLLKYDMYTQTKKNNNAFPGPTLSNGCRSSSFPRSDRCQFTKKLATLPTNIKNALFRNRSFSSKRNLSNAEELSESDSELLDKKVYHVSRSRIPKKNTIPRKKLRCEEYKYKKQLEITLEGNLSNNDQRNCTVSTPEDLNFVGTLGKMYNENFSEQFSLPKAAFIIESESNSNLNSTAPSSGMKVLTLPHNLRGQSYKSFVQQQKYSDKVNTSPAALGMKQLSPDQNLSSVNEEEYLDNASLQDSKHHTDLQYVHDPAAQQKLDDTPHSTDVADNDSTGNLTDMNVRKESQKFREKNHKKNCRSVSESPKSRHSVLTDVSTRTASSSPSRNSKMVIYRKKDTASRRQASNERAGNSKRTFSKERAKIDEQSVLKNNSSQQYYVLSNQNPLIMQTECSEILPDSINSKLFRKLSYSKRPDSAASSERTEQYTDSQEDDDNRDSNTKYEHKNLKINNAYPNQKRDLTYHTEYTGNVSQKNNFRYRTNEHNKKTVDRLENVEKKLEVERFMHQNIKGKKTLDFYTKCNAFVSPTNSRPSSPNSHQRPSSRFSSNSETMEQNLKATKYRNENTRKSSERKGKTFELYTEKHEINPVSNTSKYARSRSNSPVNNSKVTAASKKNETSSKTRTPNSDKRNSLDVKKKNFLHMHTETNEIASRIRNGTPKSSRPNSPVPKVDEKKVVRPASATKKLDSGERRRLNLRREQNEIISNSKRDNNRIPNHRSPFTQNSSDRKFNPVGTRECLRTNEHKVVKHENNSPVRKPLSPVKNATSKPDPKYNRTVSNNSTSRPNSPEINNKMRNSSLRESKNRTQHLVSKPTRNDMETKCENDAKKKLCLQNMPCLEVTDLNKIQESPSCDRLSNSRNGSPTNKYSRIPIPFSPSKKSDLGEGGNVINSTGKQRPQSATTRTDTYDQNGRLINPGQKGNFKICNQTNANIKGDCLKTANEANSHKEFNKSSDKPLERQSSKENTLKENKSFSKLSEPVYKKFKAFLSKIQSSHTSFEKEIKNINSGSQSFVTSQMETKEADNGKQLTVDTFPDYNYTVEQPPHVPKYMVMEHTDNFSEDPARSARKSSMLSPEEKKKYLHQKLQHLEMISEKIHQIKSKHCEGSYE